MPERFSKHFRARWGDMDFNAHMANTAVLDLAPDVRLMFFEENGFPPGEFERHGIGPVILEDRNDILLADGTLAARITSLGCWFDKAKRRMTVPPDSLDETMKKMPRAEDYEAL